MTTCKLAIFTLFSTLLTAQTAYPCGTKDANWSFSEVAAWEQICLTGQAVLNGASLRSPFLRQIITEAQYTVSTTVKGVSIDNATLLGDTDLSNLTFDGQLSILNSKFTGYLKLNDSKFSRSLSFAGSEIPKGVEAEHLSLTGSLFLGKLKRTEPNHDVITSSNSVTIGPVSAKSANITGAFNVYSAILTSFFDVHASHIGGDLSLMNVIGHEIIAYEATFDGQLDIVDAHLSRSQSRSPLLLDFFDPKIGRSLFLNRSVIEGSVGLVMVEVMHDVNLLGTHLHKLIASEAVVHGHLGVGKLFYPDYGDVGTTWDRIHGELDLRHASLGAILGPPELKF